MTHTSSQLARVLTDSTLKPDFTLESVSTADCAQCSRCREVLIKICHLLNLKTIITPIATRSYLPACPDCCHILVQTGCRNCNSLSPYINNPSPYLGDLGIIMPPTEPRATYFAASPVPTIAIPRHSKASCQSNTQKSHAAVKAVATNPRNGVSSPCRRHAACVLYKTPCT